MTITLIGGEMPTWSDLDGTHGPGPVRGAALAPLLATATGKTLVAGPHDPALIDALPVTDLTLVVRGVPDAQALAARYADRSGVTIRCGGIEKPDPDAAYDTIVLLDGLGRLASVEGAQLGWADTFAQFAAALKPGGRMLLALENFGGVHRVTAPPPAPTDSDWSPTGDFDLTRPGGLRHLVVRLADAGIDTVRAYAAYPEPLAPTVLLGPDLLADADRTGFVAATLGRAYAQPPTAALTDPRRVAVDVARHGTAAEMAPAWIVVAERPSHPVAAPRDLPRSVVTVSVIADAAIASGTVPAGRTLEDHLIAACLRRDLPGLRLLIGAWQSGPDAGSDAGVIVVGPDGGLHALTGGTDADAALRGFAATLTRNGYAHPFAASADEHEIAAALAAMAGRELAPAAASSPGRATVAELVIERDRLTQALTEAQAELLWYERTLAARDEALRRAQGVIELLTARGPARAGKALMGGAKAARRTARVVLRGIRPRT
jgi:hypothetical protein